MSNSGAVSRILIRGGRVYDHEGDVHQPAQTDILIAGEMIERLGQNLPASDGTEVIDAAGKLVLPGFVNAHYHSHDVVAKGLFEEMPFDIWTLHSNPSNYGPRSLSRSGETETTQTCPRRRQLFPKAAVSLDILGLEVTAVSGTSVRSYRPDPSAVALRNRAGRQGYARNCLRPPA
jgi:hypothetical protein